jgi:hypothetical protein
MNNFTVERLLAESGERQLSPEDQLRLGSRLVPLVSRPLWLFLSMEFNRRGIQYRNGLGIKGQMENLRFAWNERMLATVSQSGG